jgi:hypothetical protein
MGKKVKLFWLSEHSKTERQFNQGEFISSIQKHSNMGSEVSEGICYGICVEGMRKALKTVYSAEAALLTTVAKMRALSASNDTGDIEKLKRMALRIYTQQNYLQNYIIEKFPLSKMPAGGITPRILEECIIDGNGVTDITLHSEKEGHAIYVIRSESTGPNNELLYRIFDPNYGYSEAIPINEVIDQINAINNFYFKGVSIPRIGEFITHSQELREIKYLQHGAPKNCAKPNHIIRILEGISPINPHVKPDFDIKKLEADLGFEFITYIVFSYCADKNIDRDLSALRNFRLFAGETDIAKFYDGIASAYKGNDFEKVIGPFIDEDARLSSNTPPTALEKLLDKHPKALLRMCVKEMSKGFNLSTDLDVQALSFREQRLCAKVVKTLNDNSERKFPSLLDGIKFVLNSLMSLLSSEYGLKNEDFKSAYAELQEKLGKSEKPKEVTHVSRLNDGTKQKSQTLEV